MPHWPKPVGLLQNETSLQRMQEVLARLGNPHLKLPPTIHAAGTNGKGSTLAFLRAMLEAAGKTVHSYNTPHLIEFNERITLAGKHISDDLLMETMEEVRINSEDLRLGFYEATTAGALLAFSRAEADFLLLETGLGGRLDATNIIPAPLLTIITTISKDHTEFLGNDVRMIAIEKLGIVKPGTEVINSLQHEAVAEVIEAFCDNKNTPLKAFGYDFGIEPTATGFKYLSENFTAELPKPALLGEHQLVNAATAITAFLKIWKLAFPLTPQTGESNNFADAKLYIEQGLQNTNWPSRLEKLSLKYIPENWEFWLDGAHNPSGAFTIANFIKSNWADKPTYLIFGTTKGRNVEEFLAKFAGITPHLALSKIRFELASYEAEEMAQAAAGLGFEPSLHDSLKEAISHITAIFPPGRILACGSLFMRGDL